MISANTNLSALRLQNCLTRNTNLVQQAMHRMSTGYRINSAGDDAAGFIVASNLNTQTRGLSVANKNIQSANALLNIAEGSLSSMNNMLQRIRSLALQSANGVYSDSERSALQQEVDALLEEITRTKNTTEYNGKNLFGKQTAIDKNQSYTDIDTIQAISTMSLNPPDTNPTGSILSNPESMAQAQTVNSRMMRSQASTPSLMALGVSDETKPIETGTLTLKYNVNQKLNLGIYSYTLKGFSATSDSTVTYKYDPNTGKVEFSGNNFTVTAASGQDNNLSFKGEKINYYAAANSVNNVESSGQHFTYYSAANGVDNVTINGYFGYYKGSTSNANITLNGTGGYINASGTKDSNYIVNGDNNSIFAGNGNNTFEINANYTYVKGGSGNDAFTVNSGASNNILQGSGGDDTLIDNGTNTGKINITGYADWLPNNGRIGFDLTNRTETINIAGKTYDIKTNNDYRRSLTYKYNPTTQLLELIGQCFAITAANGQEDKLLISSANSVTIDTGDENDEVTISSNSYRNTIKTGDGDDTITNNGYQNTLYGGDGDDTINVKGSTNYVQDGVGNNNINIISGSNNIINEENSTTNTISNAGTNTSYINSPNHPTSTLPSSGTLSILAGQSMTVTFATSLGDKTYTLTNQNSKKDGVLNYSVAANGEITFNSTSFQLKIVSAANQENFVKLNGETKTYYGSNLKDVVKLASYNNVFGNDGDDEIHINGNCIQAYGENGNDKIYVNKVNDSYNVHGGNGDDYIEVNSNSNSGIKGDAGNDTIVVNGTNNKISGGGE